MKTSGKSYTASLPQKRMGAGCLFLDEQGRILLVKPTYKPGWEIPGGVVELNESPRQCCQREVKEEIGLERDMRDLLVVDYNPPTDEKTESLMFIFNGGLLTAGEIASIRLCEAELSEFRFFKAEALPSEMAVRLRRRVAAAVQQLAAPQDVYLEDQERI